MFFGCVVVGSGTVGAGSGVASGIVPVVGAVVPCTVTPGILFPTAEYPPAVCPALTAFIKSVFVTYVPFPKSILPSLLLARRVSAFISYLYSGFEAPLFLAILYACCAIGLSAGTVMVAYSP